MNLASLVRTMKQLGWYFSPTEKVTIPVPVTPSPNNEMKTFAPYACAWRHGAGFIAQIVTKPLFVRPQSNFFRWHWSKSRVNTFSPITGLFVQIFYSLSLFTFQSSRLFSENFLTRNSVSHRTFSCKFVVRMQYVVEKTS